MRWLWCVAIGSLLAMSAEAVPVPENDARAFADALDRGAQVPLRIQAMGSLAVFRTSTTPLVGVGRLQREGDPLRGQIDRENSWFTAMPVLKEGDWLQQYAVGHLPILPPLHQSVT